MRYCLKLIDGAWVSKRRSNWDDTSTFVDTVDMEVNSCVLREMHFWSLSVDMERSFG